MLPEANSPASEDIFAAMIANSGKLDLLDKMLEKLLKGGHRMLIYSQFTTVLNILEDWLTSRRLGYKRIDGSVSRSLSCM